jgi:hypothetical protein
MLPTRGTLLLERHVLVATVARGSRLGIVCDDLKDGLIGGIDPCHQYGGLWGVRAADPVLAEDRIPVLAVLAVRR